MNYVQSTYEIKEIDKSLHKYTYHCFKKLKKLHTYDNIENITVFVFKNVTNVINIKSLKYDEFFIKTYIEEILNKSGLKCYFIGESIETPHGECYKILIKKEDHPNINSILITCQAIRYLYEDPKTEIPKKALELRRKFTLLDSMECLLLAHFTIKDLYLHAEHCMIKGVVKPLNKWKFQDNIDNSCIYSIFNSNNELNDTWRIGYNLLKENKVEELIKLCNAI